MEKASERIQTLNKLGLDGCVTDPEVEEVVKGENCSCKVPEKWCRESLGKCKQFFTAGVQDVKWEGAGQGKTHLLNQSMASSTDPVWWQWGMLRILS